MKTEEYKKQDEAQNGGAARDCHDSTGSIFELVDNTSEETYYPMGYYFSLEDALEAIRDKAEPPTDDPEEYVRLEVRQHKIGVLRWWQSGRNVATLEWTAKYDDAVDDWAWSGPKINLSNEKEVD